MELHRSGTRNLDEEVDGDRWVRITEYRSPDGGTISFRSDITELKQQECQLEEQTRTLERTLESMDQGIAMVDADLNFTLHNRRLEELLEFFEAALSRSSAAEDIVRYSLEMGELGPGVSG